MLIITMMMSTVVFFALAVVASELQDEFSISKLQIGLLGAINTGVGSLLAPLSGRMSDALGGRRAMAAVLLVSGFSAILVALAQSYTFLLLAMGIAGLAQGLGNPSTNRAIATGIPTAQRGIVTGIKQSGVQLAVFTAGFLMPWITNNYGWRAGVWMIAGLSFIALLGVILITELPLDSVHGAGATSEAKSDRLPVFVTQVAIFGFLLGTIGGGIGRFLPLFAEEAAGLTAADAGRVFGLQGLVAIPTRIVSGILLDRGVPARRMLFVMALGGSVAVMLMWLASIGSPPYLWMGTVLAGMTLGSWNTAANLSMVRERTNAGKASGRLIMGFLLGTTLGGPIVGWSIDEFDSYTPAWLASAALALVGAAVIFHQPAEHDRST
jgi:predicted MFS family arabinose efflux permease